MPDEAAFEPRKETDPFGREVVLDGRAWSHLSQRRPEMLAHLEAILGTIRRPDLVVDDPLPSRERFFRRDLDPRRWLKVVVDFSQSPGFVVTAFVEVRTPGELPR